MHGQTQSIGDRLLSPTEVAAKIGVSKVSLYSWIRQGRLQPFRRVGARKVGMLMSEVDAFLASAARTAMDAASQAERSALAHRRQSGARRAA